MKTKHWIMLIFAAIGLVYVAHMMSSHQGSGILSGLGVK